MSLSAFDPHSEWLRKRSHLADAPAQERQTEVQLLLRREGNKIVAASIHKSGPAQELLKRTTVEREPVTFDYKEDERRKEEDQRQRAEVEKIGNVFKRAFISVKGSAEHGSASEEQERSRSPEQLPQTDESPGKSPVALKQREDASTTGARLHGIKAAYALLAKNPGGPSQPFASESPLTRSVQAFKSQRLKSPHTRSPGSPPPNLLRKSPFHGAKAKAKFTMAAKKVGAVVGMVKDFSQEEKDERRKTKEAAQRQAVLVSLNKEPITKNLFLKKDKIRAKVVKAVRKAAVLSTVDKGTLSTLFGPEGVSKGLGMIGDAEDILSEGGTISLHSFFRDNQDDLLSMIRKFKFFRAFSTEQSLQIADIAVLKIARSGEVLFKQDAVPDAAYIVLSGRVSLFKSKQGEQKQNPFLVATQGDSVGDRNQLDERCNRNFTAQVDGSDAELIMFPREGLDACVRSWKKEAEMRKITLLLRFPMFAGMPISMVQRLSLVLDKAVFKKDHVIYKQQDDAAAMYFIWEGRVQMLKRVDMVNVRPGREENFDDPPKKMSKSLEVAEMSDAEFFGELEVFNDLTRSSSVVALTPCTMLVLRRQDLQENVPPQVLDSLWRYSLQRVHWRNVRTQIILDTLQSIHWTPERDPRQLLDPEPKALAKMKGAAILPALTGQGTCQGPAKGAWLGAHTSPINTEAREWAMYHTGPWSTKHDTDRAKDDKGVSGANALDAAIEQESFFSHNDSWIL